MTIHRDVLAKYVTPGCLFVETGTRWGDTVIRAIELGAGFVLSCESDRHQYDMAKAHVADAFPNFRKCEIHPVVSPLFLKTIAGPYAELLRHDDVVFFLDAHLDNSSPLLDELAEIGRLDLYELCGHVTILIDDWRIVKSHAWGFGPLEVEEALRAMGPHECRFEDGYMKDDILVVQYP